MNASGIYKIKSLIKPEKVYIGSAINIKKREGVHLSCLRKNKHVNRKLQAHFNKYGESDLQFSVLLRCEKDELLKTEQYFIDFYKPWFNICPNAGNSLGTVHSKKTKMLLRESKLGNKYWLGKKHTEETKIKLSKYHQGLKMSDETKSKISINGSRYWKGKSIPFDVREKISKSKIGKKLPPFTKEHIDKIRMSKIGKKRLPFSENWKRKIGESCRKPIIQYDRQLNYIREWDSTKSATKELFINGGNISCCLSGKIKTAGGFIFRYKNVS